jgi:uncharacterized protein YlzI (FlbEa/FlbD family)
MFFNTSFIIFVLFILLVVLTAFYVWRRISNMESYAKILEKKVNTLKKDNKELRELLYTDESDANDADVIMNKIFNPEIILNNVPQKHNETIPSTTNTICNDDKCVVKEDTSDIIQNIIGESIQTHKSPVVESRPMIASINNLPVANHDTPDNDVHDIESVISDAVSGVPGVYNRKKLSKMNLDKLKDVCVSMNLSTDGTKNVLIDRILSNLTVE